MSQPLLTVLYLGDIMAKPGRQVVAAHLAELRKAYLPDLVIAQAENVTHGAGMSPAHMRELQRAGVDFFTGGNHSLVRSSLIPLLADPTEPVVVPINLPGAEPGWGAKIIESRLGPVLVAGLLGTTFPPAEPRPANPLQSADRLVHQRGSQIVATIVNFHGDFSSEKRVIGYYLDGRVSAVIGDHWHVPTADAMLLPGGTAHISDVGMCGTLHSSLGVSKEVIIRRWRDGEATRNEIAEEGTLQINALCVSIDPTNGLARHVELVQRYYGQ